MDINDVPDSGQPMSAGKKPAKRKPKVLPDELLAITDCHSQIQKSKEVVTSTLYINTV
jgi:hypothetical protein